MSGEEKEVRRLRKFANAQGSKEDGGQADDDEQLESAANVEKRCAAVLAAKGIEAITAIAVAGPPPSSTQNGNDAQPAASSWKVNPSSSVRRACGDALLALITKQDRMVRGQAVQQGALKAVLALSAPVLHNLVASGRANPAQQSASSSGLFSRSSKTSEVTAEIWHRFKRLPNC